MKEVNINTIYCIIDDFKHLSGDETIKYIDALATDKKYKINGYKHSFDKCNYGGVQYLMSRYKAVKGIRHVWITARDKGWYIGSYLFDGGIGKSKFYEKDNLKECIEVCNLYLNNKIEIDSL